MNKFFTKIAGLTLGLAMAIGVGVAIGNRDIKTASAATPGGTPTGNWEVITSASDINTTDDFLLGYVYNNKVSYTTGNAASKAIATSETLSSAKTIAFVEHKTNNVVDGYYIKTSSTVYLGSTSGKTDLTAQTDIANAAVWSLDSDLYICANTNSGRFLGSSSAAKEVGIKAYAANNKGSTTYLKVEVYKKKATTTDKIDDSSNPFTVTATPAISRTAAVPAASAWTVKAKLVGKADLVTITSGLSIVGTPSTSTVGPVNVTLRYTAASGQYPLNSGAATYDISTTMTVNPITATVAFKEAKYTIAPESTITLVDEINQTGDGNLTYSISQTDTFVSITDGVLTGVAFGTATITVTKGSEYGDSFKVTASTTVEVSNVLTWSHTFSGDYTDGTAKQTKTLSGRSWTVELTDSTYFGSSNGLQMGKAAAPASKVVLSSSAFAAYSAIKEVKVQTWGASSIVATVSVKVGDEDYKSNNNTSVSLSTSDTTIAFAGDTDSCGDIVITWLQPSTSKGIYLKSLSVTFDATPISQGGIKASWASGKGSYYNGSITDTTTFKTDHLIIDTTTASGQIYGDGNTTGVGFKTYLKNSAGKWVKTDKTTSDTEVAFIDASSALGTQAMTGFEAGTYSLYVTTAKDGGGVWTSDAIEFEVIAKAPDTITRASEPSKTEFVAYAETFTAFSGKINVVYNDGDTDNNRTPVIKYYNGNNEIDISTLLNESNKFAVNSNTTLSVRLYDNGFVGGDYVYSSYNMYIYAGTFACTDGNGSGAEYESGGTVTLNPVPVINYTDKDSTPQVLNLTASDVDLYIKVKGASGDGDAYSGTLPEVSEATQYTITAVYKGNSSYKASYDITVVNATFSINATGATKSYAYGTNFTKTGLVVQIQYGSADPIAIDPADYICEDENGNELDIIKFIGSMTVTVRYKGYSDTYDITSTNVGSSETYVHDDIPGSWELGDSTASTVSKSNVTATSLGGSSRLTKGSVLTFANAYGENTIVGAISVTFQVKSSSTSNAGATFTFKMTALSGTTETENVVTGVQKTLTASYANVTLSINNISANDEVNGWKIEVTNKANGSGSGQNGNADWDNFSGTHATYTLGPDQTFNSTPFEQALSYSNYFLELTANYCTVALTTEIKTTLSTEYNGMVAQAKVVFTSATVVRGKGATYENAISEALSRYVNMVEEKETGDFLSLGSEVLQKGTVNPVNLVSKNSSAVIVIVAISAISAAAIGGYFLFRKKKED